MHRLAALLVLPVLGACAHTLPPLPNRDEAAIRALTDAYVAGWLADDTLAVAATLAPDIVLQPAGLGPIEGVTAARAFWWPDDGSRTTITAYDVELYEVEGTGDLAFSRGRGVISFRYTQGGETSEQTNTTMSLTVYRRGANGEWRIARRMWGPLRP